MNASKPPRDSAVIPAAAIYPPAFLRPAEAAKFLSISPRQLARLTARRIFPVTRLGRKCVLYGRGDLEKSVARFRQSAIGELQI